MLNKKPIVSVATTAYNEEHTIKKMLRSVVMQREISFTLKEILVISDGSSDFTAEVARNVQDKRIKVFDKNQRLGQPARIGELLHLFEGDFLVLVDADMIFENDRVIEKLIQKIVSDKKFMLVSTHMRPLPPETFLESAINNYRFAREYLEQEFSFGNSVWGAHGCLVYAKKFAKSLKIPEYVLSVDSFSYFSCIKKDYKFAYADDAIVLYRSPQTLQDHINQATRHFIGGLQLYEHFDKEMIRRERAIPLLVMLKLMLYQLFKNPLGYIFLKVINTYCIYSSKKLAKNVNSKWQIVTSTKTI